MELRTPHSTMNADCNAGFGSVLSTDTYSEVLKRVSGKMGLTGKVGLMLSLAQKIPPSARHPG